MAENEKKSAHWNYINLWDSYIKGENKEGTGFLFSMPETSKYAAYSFWVNCAFFGEDNKVRSAVYIAVPDDYTFNLAIREYDEEAHKYVDKEVTTLTPEEMKKEWQEISDQISEKRGQAKKEYKFDRDRFKKNKEKFIAEKSKKKRVEYPEDDVRAVQPFEVDKTYISTPAVDNDDDADDEDDLDFDG